MSNDFKTILMVLNPIQSDIGDLIVGQKAVKEEIQMMKEGTSLQLYSLSNQFLGVVQDFENFARSMQKSFGKWSEQAESQVIDKVLDIHGPRLCAMENQIHRIKAR